MVCVARSTESPPPRKHWRCMPIDTPTKPQVLKLAWGFANINTGPYTWNSFCVQPTAPTPCNTCGLGRCCQTQTNNNVPFWQQPPTWQLHSAGNRPQISNFSGRSKPYRDKGRCNALGTYPRNQIQPATAENPNGGAPQRRKTPTAENPNGGEPQRWSNAALNIS